MQTGNNIVVITHKNCMDGLGAAYAATHFLGKDIEILPCQYGDPVPDVTGKDVYIFDFSFDRDVMLRLGAQARSIVAIDHHNTAVERFSDIPWARVDQSKSGALLAWEYLDNRQVEAAKALDLKVAPTPVPEIIRYISDRDLWKFELPDSKAINAFLRRQINLKWDYSLQLSMVTTLVSDWDHGLFAMRGELILDVISDLVNETVRRWFWITLFVNEGEGERAYRLPCSFAQPSLASDVGHELANRKDNDHGVGVVLYTPSDGKAIFSLRGRKDTMLAEEIAKSYGGGGHPTAAGFSVGAEHLGPMLNTMRF